MGHPEQVNTGQVTGESSRRNEVVKSNHRESFTKKKGKITPRSQSFKRSCYVASHSRRRNNDQRNDNRQRQDSEEQTSTQPKDLNCPRYTKYRPNRPCRAELGVYYECGKPGHIARDCPHRKRGGVAESDPQTRGNHELAVEFLTFLHTIDM
ncbi:hypothetical protein Ahy_B06g081469 [Arachis hypogaea]|uniref:CCHC-type domain-containing protein n=1 Tax=Arachis hypogaea TaxID=3818 RepID=A0A444YL34_ARAHY|nr:hypothetical protein Ahy_B06g081469 [Arachis hypogaea]